MTAKVVTSPEGYKEHNGGEFKKRDTVIVNAVNKFRNGQSELRGELAKLETSLATIAASLATLSRSNKRSRIVKESDDSSESEEEEERPRKKNKKKKKTAAASSTSKSYSRGDKFHPDMQWNHRWDLQTMSNFRKAQEVYAKTHPEFKKALHAEKKAAAAISTSKSYTRGDKFHPDMKWNKR